MVAIHTPITKTRTYSPTWEKAVFTEKRGLAQRQYRRVKVNDLSPLWPESHFRTRALHFAEQFKRDMEKQGYILNTAEADVLVSGPFKPRHWDKAANGGYRGTRHWRQPTPSGRVDVEVDLLRIAGRNLTAESEDDTEDFLLEAEFISTRTVLIERYVKDPNDAA